MPATQESSSHQTQSDALLDFRNRQEESYQGAKHVVLDGPRGRFSWRDFINLKQGEFAF